MSQGQRRLCHILGKYTRVANDFSYVKILCIQEA